MPTPGERIAEGVMMNVANNTLEHVWLACTEACAYVPDFKIAKESQVNLFAITLTECTSELKVRCEKRLVHLHGGMGEVGPMQIRLECLHDALRFWKETTTTAGAYRKGQPYNEDAEVIRPGLRTFSEQFFTMLWYLSTYRSIIQWKQEKMIEWRDEHYARLWHYGPDMTEQEPEEWQQYEARWLQQLSTAYAWAGRKQNVLYARNGQNEP